MNRNELIQQAAIALWSRLENQANCFDAWALAVLFVNSMPPELATDGLDASVNSLDVSVRVRNCFEAMNVKTVGELVSMSPVALLCYRKFGETSLGEVRRALAAIGLSLAGDSKPDNATWNAAIEAAAKAIEQCGRYVNDSDKVRELKR